MVAERRKIGGAGGVAAVRAEGRRGLVVRWWVGVCALVAGIGDGDGTLSVELLSHSVVSWCLFH